MTRNVNSDRMTADLLLELKRHLKTCKSCQGATKARDRTALCDHTIGLILSIAIRYDHVIPRRLQIKRRKDPHVFACPDLSLHGPTYALIAEPLIVTGIEGTLF